MIKNITVTLDYYLNGPTFLVPKNGVCKKNLSLSTRGYVAHLIRLIPQKAV